MPSLGSRSNSSNKIRPPSKGSSLAKQVASQTRKRTHRAVHEILHGHEVSKEGTSYMQRLTHSRYYEWFSGTLTLMNAMFIGFQTQAMALDAEDDALLGVRPLSSVPAGFLAAEIIFTVLFGLELGLRWFSEGLIQFFLDDEVAWNAMDALVVVMSILDLVLYALVDKDDSRVTGNVSMMRVVRVVRIVRVVRVIRIMKFFRELRI
eukprot:UN3468